MTNNELTTDIKAADLKIGMVIIDPEGHFAKVIRIRRIDHRRGRLETDQGIAQVALTETFPVLPSSIR